MSPGMWIGRRKFLATGAAVGASYLLNGCKGDGPASLETDPGTLEELLAAVIEGPDTLSLPSVGTPVVANYDSSRSTGIISRRVWTILKTEDAFEEGEKDLGSTVSVETTLTRPGSYLVDLRITGRGVVDTTEFSTLVHPPPLPGVSYSSIAFYRLEDDGSEDGIHSIHLMNPSTLETTRLGGSPKLPGQKLAWDPGGGRLAFEWGSNTLGVRVYDLLRDEAVDISPPGEGSSWLPSWSPQGDWISMSSLARASHPEVVLVRPDGSESLFLSGNSPRIETSGSHTSWSPDGERLAAAECAFPEVGGSQRRIGIFENLWGGNAVRRQVPTEAQLVTFLESQGDDEAANMLTLRPGIAGLSWSPDGEELAFTLYYGDEVGHKEWLLKCRVDGTGEIQPIADRSQLAYPFVPTWSPSGSHVLVTGQVGSGSQLFKVGATGSPAPPVNVSNSPFLEKSPAHYQ